MALPVTVADFRTEFPEFPVSVISDARVSSLLQRAKRLHTATKAGTLYAAAHLHCLDKVSGRDVEGGAAAATADSALYQRKRSARSRWNT